MPLYVTLGKYTSEVMKNINEVSERLQQNTRLVESKGGKLVDFMGSWKNGTFWPLPSSAMRRAP
jgi:uncharacterized protein with GYD domain